ncbi:MAG: hypothetical protein DRP83_00030 [Planctomycetota bacterium]|nr:MAG: hypothetical protein DRP83_00030 [Planctomycetota bacterium]
MKYMKLTNVSPARKAYSGLRDGSGRPLVLDPGDMKPVHPGVMKHRTIEADIRAGVLSVQMPGEEAPKPAPTPAPADSPPADPPADTPPADNDDVDKDDGSEDDNAELRELFLSAPGITEKNVNAVLDAYTNLQELADASEEDLVAAGVTKSFAGRVVEWAIENL